MRSPRLRDMFRVASVGLSDREVIEKTGLGYSLWRKMLTGDASERSIIQFCAGLGIPSEAYLKARRESAGRVADELGMVMAVLEATTLPQLDKRELMEEFMRRRQVACEQEPAA